MILLKDISTDEYPEYFLPYLSLVDRDVDVNTVLQRSLDNSLAFINSIDKPLDYRYASGKWTIAQVIMHNIDTERVFAYRALRFMRGDATALSGFDQDIFVNNLEGIAFAKADLIQSLETTRNATLTLFKNASEPALKFKGNASEKMMSARIIPFIIAGHNMHHENIIRERYLS